MVNARTALIKEKEIQPVLKAKEAALQTAIAERIPRLTDEEVRAILREKWVAPLHASLKAMAVSIPEAILHDIEAIMEKYSETALDIEEKSREAGRSLAAMMTELTGSEYDERGWPAGSPFSRRTDLWRRNKTCRRSAFRAFPANGKRKHWGTLEMWR